jgi:hypothetical protein
LRGSDAAGQDPIGQAYRFFRSHVELLDPVRSRSTSSTSPAS